MKARNTEPHQRPRGERPEYLNHHLPFQGARLHAVGLQGGKGQGCGIGIKLPLATHTSTSLGPSCPAPGKAGEMAQVW